MTKCHLVDSLIRHTHNKYQHCGIGLTVSLTRERYFIHQRVKKSLRSCIRLIRMRGQSLDPKMANISANEVNPAETFKNISTDLCGPFIIKLSKLPMNVYIVVFIRMFTKAVHLEVCSDLSSVAFLTAFQRIVRHRASASYINQTLSVLP